MNIKSNIALQDMFSYLETGYLQELIDLILTSNDLSGHDFYIYFKRTNEHWNLDQTDMNSSTILIIVVDESGFIPKSIQELPKVTFKTYLENSDCVKQIYHLPVGTKSIENDINIKPINERPINVFFSGNLHSGRYNFYQFMTGVRWIPFALLHRLTRILGTNFSNKYSASYIRFTSKFASGLNLQDYFETLAKSKIVLCPPGNPGLETIRHYEALKFGCVIISEKLPDCNSFNGSPIHIVDDWQESSSIINMLLKNPDKLDLLHKQALAWWNKKCSPKATLEYLVKTINRNY